MTARVRVLLAAGAMLAAQACASAPVAVAPTVAGPTFDQKMAWILELEDERRLALPQEAPAPPPPPVSSGRRGRAARAVPAPPPPPPSLLTLLADAEARVRRRAALGVGRVGLPEGVAPLSALLASDADAEVRLMAAFALGLIGDAAATEALTTALGDADPRVQGRAAEALGQIGAAGAAGAVGSMVAAHVRAGALADVDPDDQAWPRPPAVEAARLGIYALVRLGAIDPLLAALTDGTGTPVSEWWPVAYAFQRVGKPAAAPVLRALLRSRGQLTRAFAARGLGGLKDGASREALGTLALDATQPAAVRIQAVRALGLLADPQASPMLRKVIAARDTSRTLRLEAVTAIGLTGDRAAEDLLVDLMADPWPSMRAAATGALARVSPDTFLIALSTLDADPHWSVRAAQAGALAMLTPEQAGPRLLAMAADRDSRVRPAVLDALVQVKHPDAGTQLLEAITADDFVVRAAAARGLATLRPAGAAAALSAALATAQGDPTYVARAAILGALAEVDAAAAAPALVQALTDRDWAVRVRAAQLLRKASPGADVSAMRPAPAPVVPELRDLAALAAPPVTPQAYIDTEKGMIQVELYVLDAPRTVANFIALAGRGFFTGNAWHRVVPDFVVQDGDPRGDGEGGPGHTIRDELNERPYLRGTVGMALDWEDTGGSQFFITHSPQPHLDARYTVFGQVVAGMDVVDRLEQWDQIRSVRVWDGTAWIGK